MAVLMCDHYGVDARKENQDDWVKLEEKLWKKHWGDWNEGENGVE